MRRTFIAVIILAVLLATVGAAQAKKGFSGVVEALPPGGLVGEWVISGVPVLVTPETKLKFKHGPPFVGARVKVDGYYLLDGRYSARTIKEKKPKKKW